MSYLHDLDVDGLDGYVVEIHGDDGCDAPWEREDGHGPVSDWRVNHSGGHPPTMAGELVLCWDRHSYRTYDFAEAVKIARREGWDSEPYNDGSQTKGEQAAKAARADYERLRAWGEGEWHYVGVVVRRAGECRACGDSESLWGIESDADDYLAEVARDLAAELEAVTA